MLLSITLFINFVFLIASIWLGIYVVTRNPRSLISWLAGLTLWSVAGLFLNMLFAINPPPLPQNMPGWIYILLPFWPIGTTEGSSSGWLLGWLVIPAIVIWHHVTMLLRPGSMNPWRWTRVLLGYGAAIVAIILLVYTDLLFYRSPGDPIFLDSLNPGPLYSIFMGLLILFTAFSLVNLSRSVREASAEMQRNQLRILTIATIIAGLTGPLGLIAETFSIAIPRVILSILLGIAVVLLGYGIAQYSALVQGRTVRRDFIYNAIAIAVISCLYLLVVRISAILFAVPAAVYIFIVILAVLTHSLIDNGRRILDYLFYDRERRAIRQNLADLASSVGDENLKEGLRLTLDAMCGSVRATFGLVVIFDTLNIKPIATYRWRHSNLPLSRGDLLSDDLKHLEPGSFPHPLDDLVLLIPLYRNSDQIGAILFGRPINGVRYSQSDVNQLLYPSDLISDVIQDSRREEKYLDQLPQFTQAQQLFEESHPEISIKDVEDALRNLYDFAHLGDSPLAGMKLVNSELTAGPVTHIDRGKAFNNILTMAVEKLKPAAQLPGEPVPREWYPYLILHGAYIDDKLNRDIMSHLYISEGTFNRTRRSAVRSVKRMLEEMEAALS
ncbi:MAG: hypothetical protein JSV42_10785 [Chloroflexota bacterium]|nr:MAG: hypothetical protein JSV42_10785 [Chloroflexota bacterium]